LFVAVPATPLIAGVVVATVEPFVGALIAVRVGAASGVALTVVVPVAPSPAPNEFVTPVVFLPDAPGSEVEVPAVVQEPLAAWA
jgi:hypothetical protein